MIRNTIRNDGVRLVVFGDVGSLDVMFIFCFFFLAPFHAGKIKARQPRAKGVGIVSVTNVFVVVLVP